MRNIHNHTYVMLFNTAWISNKGTNYLQLLTYSLAILINIHTLYVPDALSICLLYFFMQMLFI